MSVPELKQKKLARDAEIAKLNKAASEAAVKEQAEMSKTIFAKAKAYEEEYAKVIFVNSYKFL